MRRRCRWAVVVATWLMLVVVVSAAPGEAQESPASEEIVKMLRADLAEEVILEWLQGQPVASGPLSADDLVALKTAGASTDLLSALIEWTRGSPATGGVPVTFKVSYLARFEAPDPVWDLYIYLDGLPLAYLPTASIENRAETRELVLSVPAGQHLLRVAQERHARWRGRWDHESRVATEAFPFELAAGSAARMELEFSERLMDVQDPLVFKLVQGSRAIDSGRVGGEAEFWPLVCEDIRASLPEGKKPGREKRQRLEQCVGWDGLWSSGAPSRQEVLDVMAGFDFRPIPKGS